MYGQEKKEILVDALMDGKIIRATEDFARREGLLILKRHEPMNPNVSKPEVQGGHVTKNERKGLLKFEEFRRPLKGDNHIFNELIHNFHWIVMKRRKEKNVSRKQMATDIGVPEYDLKMFESGVCTTNDFIFVSKVEKYLGINLRKDGKDYNKSALQSLKPVPAPVVLKQKDQFKSEKPGKEESAHSKIADEQMSGDDIELDLDLDD